MAAIVCDLGDARGAITITGSPSNDEESSWKNSTIAAPSNRDRSAIEPRSWFLQRRIKRRFSHLIRRRSTGDQDHDRRTIVARSWSDRGPFQAKIKAKLPPIRKPQHRLTKLLPRSPKTAFTIASNGLKIGPNFPFKNPCISPLFFNS